MTTRTVSIDLIRRDASRHRRDQRDLCRTRSDVTHIDDGLLAGEAAARVAHALQSLAPEERDAIIRAYYDGRMAWLNTVERGRDYAPGDLWGSVGAWFAGRWRTPAAERYIGEVKAHLRQRTWRTAMFRGGDG